MPNDMTPNKRKSAKGSKVQAKLPPGLVKAVKNAVLQDAERKFWDTVLATSIFPSYNGSTPVSLTDIVQGSSDTTRVGDAVVVKRIQMKIRMSINAAYGPAYATGAFCTLRAIVFAWKPFFASVAPTVAQLLTYTGNNYANIAPLTHDGRDQFVIILDQVVFFDNYKNASKLIQINKQLNHKIQWKAGSTTNGAGMLFVAFISDSNGGSGVEPVVQNYVSRVDYTDM